MDNMWDSNIAGFLIRMRVHTQTQLGPEMTGHLSPVRNLTIIETLQLQKLEMT